MHCFYTEKENIGGGQVRIVGADVNHIKNVLRMDKGEEITVCDGDGSFFSCRLRELGQDMAVADILVEQKAETELGVRITLFQGLPKKDKMELIIQKAVELGADEIIPVATRFCIAKLEAGKKEQKKLERWQAISEAAAKQSGRGKIPQIKPLVEYQKAVRLGSQMDICLLPYEKAEGMRVAKRAIKACGKLAKGSQIGVFIGPEGGFDKPEVEMAIQAGIQPISLGKRILRTETAGLCILSALMLELEAAAAQSSEGA